MPANGLPDSILACSITVFAYVSENGTYSHMIFLNISRKRVGTGKKCREQISYILAIHSAVEIFAVSNTDIVSEKDTQTPIGKESIQLELP